MKWYEKKCIVCGESIVSTVNTAKYCTKCRKKAYSKLRGKHAVGTLNDSEAMRQACLTCRRPSCSGACEELAQIAREESDKHD